MNKPIVVAVLVLFTCLGYTGAALADGKGDFEQFCSGCHPDGGNTINPAKTLRKMTREANGIRRPADIVRILRNPGEGMRRYTKQDLSNERAEALAAYILKTF